MSHPSRAAAAALSKTTPSKGTLLKVAALALALGGCAVGPDHVRPSMAMPERFAQGNAADIGTDAPLPAADTAFWHGFGDVQLDALVADALTANHDLRIALSRYDRANALLRGAKFDRIPTLTAQAEGSDGRSSADQAPGVARADRDAESYSVGASAAWELDLFGRIRRNVEAGRADVAASAADLAAAQVAIAGDVARTYFDLRGLQTRLRVARENADTQAETLKLVQARHDAGRDSAFDLARARTQQASTAARIPELEAQAALAMHRLAVLTGRPPEALLAELSPEKALPALAARIEAGTPGDLLRRRPDITAAEARLHASTARIGVATADLFPKFTLRGLIGSQAIDTSNLFMRDSETRLVALGVDWSFLDIGRVRARIAAADADAAGALAEYERTVLLALEDTENALVRHARAREQDALLAQAADGSAQAARLARVRFNAGATGLLEVLDAERTRLQAEDAFADARTRTATSAVALYEALAGGWPETLPVEHPVAAK